MNGNFARSILCSLVTSVDFGWYSSIVGVWCFSCGPCSCCVVAARGQTMSAANVATKMTEKKVMVRREFIVPLGFLNVRLIFPQEGGRAPWNPLLESAAMPQPTLFRFLLLAALAVTAGFLGLAIAVPIEPQVPAPLILDRQRAQLSQEGPHQQTSNRNKQPHVTMSFGFGRLFRDRIPETRRCTRSRFPEFRAPLHAHERWFRLACQNSH